MLRISDVKDGYYHIRLLGARVLTVVCARTPYIPMAFCLTLMGLGATDYYTTTRSLHIRIISKLAEEYKLDNLLFPHTKFILLEQALDELSRNKDKYNSSIAFIRDKIETNRILNEIYNIARKTKEVAFTLPDSLHDLQPIYNKPMMQIQPQIQIQTTHLAVEKKEPVRQLISTPLPHADSIMSISTTNPFHDNIINPNVGEKRPRPEDIDNDLYDAKRRKVNNTDALMMISRLETQLTTAFFEIQKLKQLLDQ